MRQWMCMSVVVLALIILPIGSTPERDVALAAPVAPGALSATGLITHVQELDGKMLRVVVIDPAQRVMGVYDIGRDTGEIQPKSIRNFSADLQMLEYNSGAPSPADIRNSLERK